MFIAGSLGAIILLLILRFAARFGVKKVLGLLSAIYGFAIILFYYFSSPVKLVNEVFQYFPNLNNYFGFLENPAIKLLPNYWISESLYWMVSGNITAALWYVYLLVVVSIIIFLLALYTAKRWYYKTWLVLLDLPADLAMKRRRKNKIFGFENNTKLTPRREAVLKREFIMFFREPSQWTHFLVMILLITVFISSLRSIDVIITNAYNTQIKTLVYLIVYLFNVFLIASLSLRFVFPLVSLEGETIWKIRSSPLNYKKLLITRLLIYFSVIFIIGQLLNFFSNYRFSIQLAAISQLNTTFVTITLVSLNFGMGAVFANYKEKNPIRIASSQGASLTFLFTIIYLVFLIILLFPPIINYFESIQTGRNISLTELIYTSLILGSLCAIISYLAISTGIRYFGNDV